MNPYLGNLTAAYLITQVNPAGLVWRTENRVMDAEAVLVGSMKMFFEFGAARNHRSL
jgi:hypothetical protein